MTVRIASLLLAGCFLISGVAVAQAASAQTTSAQTASGQTAVVPPTFAPKYGPAVNGVCVFSQADAVARSAAGVSANSQLQTLTAGVRSELEPERAAIVAADRDLQSKKATMTAAAYQKATQALQQRAQVFAQTARTRELQLQTTRTGASQQIADALAPTLSGVVTAHRCGLVIERGGIYGSNPSMDLTTEVVRALDGRLAPPHLTLAAPTAAASSAAH